MIVVGRRTDGQRLEAVRGVQVQRRLTLTGLDLVATSVAAFVGGCLMGYLVSIS